MLENKVELALSGLENGAEYAIMFDTLPEKAQHTSLLLNKLKFDMNKTSKNFNFTDCKFLYDKMQSEIYDSIREDKRFIAVLDKIKEYC